MKRQNDLKMTNVESELLQAKNKVQVKSYSNLNYTNSNHLRFVLSKKGNNRKNEAILEKNKLFT